MNEIDRISRYLGFMPLSRDYSHEVLPRAFSSSDTSCVLYKGDNELILSGLQKELTSLVDFCYIDPPYNTRNTFIYDDKRVSSSTSLFGSHATWMQFMLSRLVLAKKLLKDTGIIAISIDDYEQPYLRILMDNIFGEDNFIGNITVCRSKNGNGSNKNNVAVNHEYILLYGKTKKAKIIGFNDVDETYKKEDSHGKYKTDGLFRKKGDHSLREDRPNLFYPLYYDNQGNVYTKKENNSLKEVYPMDSKGIERRWLWGKEKATTESWKLYASPRGVVYIKNYFSSGKRKKIRTLWDDNRYLTERATKEIKDIYGDKIFDTPKPLNLIEDLIDCCTNKNSLILDFFAGSGTTAHSAYVRNLLDKGNRKVVLVEHMQEISKKHTAYKKGFQYIADITEKRLAWIQTQDENYQYSVFS